jgi:hydroxymethylpyrimidine pyrophosphatase-like HAD family hydrolase
MNLTESVKDLSSYKLNILSFRKSKIIKALAELENKYKGVLTFSHSHPKLIEINLFNVNKGSGIKFVAEQLKVNLNQVAVIGDSNNDLPAFLVSDLSIAVKTKSVILKEKATHYLGYKKNAVADAIRKYVLSSNSIQLVASDLDGTLLRNGTKEIDNFSKTTIIEMVDKLNKKFVVCTGRSIDDTLLVVDYFKFKNIKNVFAICVNGGCIYDIANKKYLFEHTMKEELVQRVLSIFHEFQNDKTLKGQIAIEAFLDYDNGSLIKKETQTHYLINKDYIYNYYLSRHPGMLTNF